MSSNTIYIYDYTAKSFVIRGDTQPHKESIKAMGGKWGSNYTDKETGEKFGGWLFWTAKRPELDKWIKEGCKLVESKAKSVPTSWDELGVDGSNFKASQPVTDERYEMKEALVEIVNILKQLSPDSMGKLFKTSFYQKYCKTLVPEESDVDYEEETDMLPPRRLLGRNK